MPATASPADDDTAMRPPADVVDSDQDAEGEEETDLYQMDQQLQDAVHRAYSVEVAEEVDSTGREEDKDADGEQDSDVDLNGDNNETEPVGAVKLPKGRPSLGNGDAVDADGDTAFENQSDSDQDASGTGSSSRDSDEDDEEWDGESNDRDDVEVDNHTVRGNCM
jgi:histone acetyltransferase SAS3